MKKQVTLMLMVVLFIISSAAKVNDRPFSTLVNRGEQEMPVNFQQIVKIEGEFSNPCTGEMVQLTGQGHYELHGNINKNMLNSLSHFNVQGIKGVGVTSGTVYKGSETTQVKQTISFTNPSSTYTEVHSFKMVSPQKNNNLVVKYVFHITINANGVVTAFVGDNEPTLTCK